jgi:hypothetical protein
VLAVEATFKLTEEYGPKNGPATHFLRGDPKPECLSKALTAPLMRAPASSGLTAVGENEMGTSVHVGNNRIEFVCIPKVKNGVAEYRLNVPKSYVGGGSPESLNGHANGFNSRKHEYCSYLVSLNDCIRNHFTGMTLPVEKILHGDIQVDKLLSVIRALV